MQKTMRTHGILVLALMMIAGAVWAAAPEAAEGEATLGVAIETPIDADVQRVEPALELGSCGESGLDLGLPRAVLTSDVISFCPVDGTFCIDPNICRYECRVCGTELAACILGICRCIDT